MSKFADAENVKKIDDIRQARETRFWRGGCVPAHFSGCENYAEAVIAAKSQNESFARTCVASFVASLDPTMDVISDIKTAVSEAVTNSIVHGYNGTDGGYIKLHMAVFPGKTVKIVVEDFGCGISDVSLARQPLFTTRPELDRSGMGFTIMENFMDELIVQSAAGEGTRVTMVKKVKD